MHLRTICDNLKVETCVKFGPKEEAVNVTETDMPEN